MASYAQTAQELHTRRVQAVRLYPANVVELQGPALKCIHARTRANAWRLELHGKSRVLMSPALNVSDRNQQNHRRRGKTTWAKEANEGENSDSPEIKSPLELEWAFFVNHCSLLFVSGSRFLPLLHSPLCLSLRSSASSADKLIRFWFEFSVTLWKCRSKNLFLILTSYFLIESPPLLDTLFCWR